MICVIATLELAAGRRAEFLAEFRRVVPLVLKEQGCLEYAPMIDVPTSLGVQIPSRGDAVIVVEKWESVAALEAHLVAPHMVEYRKRVKDLVLGSTLQVLEPA